MKKLRNFKIFEKKWYGKDDHNDPYDEENWNDENDILSEKESYKPVIRKENAKYYVSEGEMIGFITQNSGMDWNDCCDYVRDNHITGEEGRVSWSKRNLDHPEWYNQNAIHWIGAFFDAHPFMENIMIVFDD